MVDVGFGLWWSEVDRKYAREKVCNTFRDAIKQLNHDNHRVWGETARFSETESFASIVALVENEMMEQMEEEESEAKSTPLTLEDKTADAAQNLVEELSIVERTTHSVERAQLQGTSLVEVLNNVLEDNGESEDLEEEYVQLLSSLAKTAIDEMKDQMGNIEDETYVQFDEGCNKERLSPPYGLTTTSSTGREDTDEAKTILQGPMDMN